MTHIKFTKGFTIIELLVAIFVLVVGIVGVLNAFPLGVQVEKSAQMATIATQLSQAKMEEIISKSFTDISSESKQPLASPFSAYSREVEVVCYDPNGVTLPPDCPDTGIKKIKVTVSWKSPLGVSTKKVELFSLITKR